MCTIVPDLNSAEDQTQVVVYTRQIFHQLSYTTSPTTPLAFSASVVWGEHKTVCFALGSVYLLAF